MRKSSRQYSLECEGRIYLYYITDDGNAIRKLKNGGEETAVKIYLKRGKAAVKINNKEMMLKHLVARHFLRGYRPGASVTCKDGNPLNCSAGNLAIYSKKELGSLTGHMSRSRPVIINGKRYRSVRDASKHLPASYQTIYDCINGKVNNSVIDGWDITLCPSSPGNMLLFNDGIIKKSITA